MSKQNQIESNKSQRGQNDKLFLFYFERIGGDIKNYCCYLCKGSFNAQKDARVLFNETMSRMWEKMHKFRFEDYSDEKQREQKFKSWVCTIAVNKWNEIRVNNIPEGILRDNYEEQEQIKKEENKNEDKKKNRKKKKPTHTEKEQLEALTKWLDRISTAGLWNTSKKSKVYSLTKMWWKKSPLSVRDKKIVLYSLRFTDSDSMYAEIKVFAESLGVTWVNARKIISRAKQSLETFILKQIDKRE